MLQGSRTVNQVLKSNSAQASRMLSSKTGISVEEAHKVQLNIPQGCADELVQKPLGKGVRGVVFNRPKALNALNLDMVRELTPRMKRFEELEDVYGVVFSGSGGKAFCAGGDIRSLYDNGKEDATRDNALAFFREEYALNYLLGTMKTPVASILNGITMGGGVGLSLHGEYVVATDNTMFAMPETAIGFFPDVGTSYILPRLGRRLAEGDKYEVDVDDKQRAKNGQGLGTYLALTGERVKAQEMNAMGLATHYVPSDALDLMMMQFGNASAPDADSFEEVLDAFTTEEGEQELTSEFVEAVEHIFGTQANSADDSVEGIFDRLANFNQDAEWAAKITKKLQRMSPLSLKVTLEQMRRGAELGYEEVFEMEYRIANRMMENPDFFEGVRATIVDKDGQPKWKHATVEDVTDAEVQAFFAPLDDPAKELRFGPLAEKKD